MLKPIYSLLALYAVSGQECDDPGRDDNADRIDLDTNTVMYSCLSGYQSILFQPTITLSCMGGQWGPENPPSVSPVCITDSATTERQAVESTTQVQSCPDPGLVDNSERYFDNFDHGGMVYFACKKDFCAKDMRTRTIEMECRNGKWTAQPPKCIPCEPCIPPPEADLEAKKISMKLNKDFTASLMCDEGHVITPGTSIEDGTVECIEGGEWAPEIPTCSVKPQVVCGGNEISVIINKNMLDNLGFSGGVNSLAMTGINANAEIIMKGCKPELDDAGENYSFHIQSPYAGKCMTHFQHVKHDGLGNESNNYNFRNKIVWRQNSGAVMRSSTILDFTCEYAGLFTTGLDGPIKLALSTRTYIDKRKGFNQQEFTVSMGIYANKNFTNLLESSQVVHRGKRYFVALWLHESELGTPFLDRCYGSPNEVSQDELIKLGRQPEADSQVRELIVDGCPAALTLTRLEIPGSTADRRFSFMYPYVSVDGYSSNYMYIHCEMKLRPTGFKPNCVRPNSAPAGSQDGGGLTDATGEKLGKDQYFQREYGYTDENGFAYDHNDNANNLDQFLQRSGMGFGFGANKYGDGGQNAYNRNVEIQNSLSAGDLTQQQQNNQPEIMGKSANFGNSGYNNNPYDQFESFGDKRRKRRSIDQDPFSVSLGPMILVMDEDVNPEDIKEVTIQTKVPLIAKPDGTIAVDETAAPAESYNFKYNTTYKSREDDVEKYKKLLPEDRYVEKFDNFPGTIEWESEKQIQDEDQQLENAVENIVAESIEEQVEEEEEIEAENFAVKAICIIAGFIVGGLILFALALYITMNTDICMGSSANAKNKTANKNRARKSNSSVPNVVVAGPDMSRQMASDEKELNKSCASSLTSAES